MYLTVGAAAIPAVDRLLSMTRPTAKQLVVQSLRTLHKGRMRRQFRIRALQRQRRELNEEERAVRSQVQSIERKIDWEVNTHSDILNDQPGG